MASKRYIWVAIITVILAASGWYYFFYLPSTAPTGFDAIFSDSAKNFYYFDADADETISKIEKLLAEAPTKDAEVSAKMLLAFAYQNIDTAKSVSLFKEIAENESYSDMQRAKALTAMADIFMLGSRFTGKLADEIFSGEPYASFRITDGTSALNTRTLIGIRRLYEYSTEIYPLPFAYYRSAKWFGKLALNAELDKNIRPQNSKEFYITYVKEKIASGDAAYTNFVAIGGSKTEQGYSKWLKGAALAILGELEKNKKYFEEAETAFKDSLALLANTGEPGRSRYNKSNELWGRFYYAHMLALAYGDSRSSDIQEILKTINFARKSQNDSELGLFRYLRRIGAMPPPGGMQAYDIRAANALAGADPEFAETLRSLGWNLK